jgi:hypothetical protein
VRHAIAAVRNFNKQPKPSDMKFQAYASQKQKSCKATYIPTHNCSTFVFAPTHNDHSSQSKLNMKPLFLLLTVLLLTVASYSQSYLGKISKQVNLREGPGTEYQVIASLKPTTQIFIVSLETEDDFYNVIYIATNKSGYVHKNYVTIGKELPKSEGGFTPSGSSGQENPEAEIFNNTSQTMTLRLNSETYTFKPREKKTVALSVDTYSFIASAPGVIPYYGSKAFESSTRYTWEFYIVTRYR